MKRVAFFLGFFSLHRHRNEKVNANDCNLAVDHD
jgi:hypothetical protein